MIISFSSDKLPKGCNSLFIGIIELTIFGNLSLENDIITAQKAYNSAIKAECFDVAGYCYLLSLKTNIGFNANARSLEYMLQQCKLSPLDELNSLSYHLYDLLSKTIEPFITRVNPVVTNIGQIITPNVNPLGIYHGNGSVTALYKHNITNLLKTYDKFHDELADKPATTDQQKAT